MKLQPGPRKKMPMRVSASAERRNQEKIQKGMLRLASQRLTPRVAPAEKAPQVMSTATIQSGPMIGQTGCDPVVPNKRERPATATHSSARATWAAARG